MKIFLQISLCTAWAIVLLMVPEARAQKLVVAPTSDPIAMQAALEEGLARFDVSTWHDGYLDMHAFIVTPGDAPVLVTPLVQWTLESEGPASISVGGRLVAPGGMEVRVFAEMPGGLLSAPFIVALGESVPQGSPPPSLLQGDPPRSYNNEEIEQTVGDALDHYESRGWDVTELRASLDRTLWVDSNYFGINYPGVVGFLNDATDGMWMSAGAHRDKNHNVLVRLATTIVVFGDTTIIQHPLLVDLVQDGPATGSGGASRAWKVVFHEMLHEIIDEFDLEISVPRALLHAQPGSDLFSAIDTQPPPDGDGVLTEVEIEEFFARNMEEAMSDISEILEVIHDADGEVGQGQKRRLQGVISRLRTKLALLRTVLGPLFFDAMMFLLNWEDSDGDNIPDFVEDALRDAGLDPDGLFFCPECPTHMRPPIGPGGGGVNPAED